MPFVAGLVMSTIVGVCEYEVRQRRWQIELAPGDYRFLSFSSEVDAFFSF